MLRSMHLSIISDHNTMMLGDAQADGAASLHQAASGAGARRASMIRRLGARSNRLVVFFIIFIVHTTSSF